MPPEEIRSIEDLTLDPQNARKRTERSHGTIVKSLEKFGGMRSIVLDDQNRVRAGNGTVEAAAQIGIHKVRIIDADGHEIIAVRRKGLSEEEWKTYAIADNRSSELSEWEPEVLLEYMDEGVDLSQFWYEEELQSLWEDAAQLNDGGDFEDEDGGSGVDSDRYVIPIVLNPRENQIWQAVKRGYGLKDDKKVFLKLLEGVSLDD